MEEAREQGVYTLRQAQGGPAAWTGGKRIVCYGAQVARGMETLVAVIPGPEEAAAPARVLRICALTGAVIAEGAYQAGAVEGTWQFPGWELRVADERGSAVVLQRAAALSIGGA